jgi:hypothetical protein
LPEILAIKLRQQTVTQRFSGNPGLVRQKKYGTFTHYENSLWSPHFSGGVDIAWLSIIDCPFPRH